MSCGWIGCREPHRISLSNFCRIWHELVIRARFELFKCQKSEIIHNLFKSLLYFALHGIYHCKVCPPMRSLCIWNIITLKFAVENAGWENLDCQCCSHFKHDSLHPQFFHEHPDDEATSDSRSAFEDPRLWWSNHSRLFEGFELLRDMLVEPGVTSRC